MSLEITVKFVGEEAEKDAMRALDATPTLCDLHDFQTFLRSCYKYEEHEGKAAELLERIRERFYECMGKHLEKLD